MSIRVIQTGLDWFIVNITLFLNYQAILSSPEMEFG